jgi:hypothetical protein
LVCHRLTGLCGQKSLPYGSGYGCGQKPEAFSPFIGSFNFTSQAMLNDSEVLTYSLLGNYTLPNVSYLDEFCDSLAEFQKIGYFIRLAWP